MDKKNIFLRMQQKLAWFFVFLLMMGCQTKTPTSTPTQTFAPPQIEAVPPNEQRVLTIVPQDDGKIMVGGVFSSLGGQTVNMLARLNSDGTLDNSFNPIIRESVYAIAIQADGKILVGGGCYFYTLSGEIRNWFARLNSDGTLDTSFNDIGTTDFIYAITLQPDGKVLIGGLLQGMHGGNANFARLNSDGNFDNTFGAKTDGEIDVILIQPDSKIVIGGTFRSIFTNTGLYTHAFISRINPNGDVDLSFLNANSGVNGIVHALALQTDGKIIVGGQLVSVDQSHYVIARLNSDGTLDPTFNFETNEVVYAIAIQPDGKIVVGGHFTILGGETREHIARLNPDGTLDDTFNPGANGIVYTLYVQPDGKILLGGQFTIVDGQPRDQIARLNLDGTLDNTFNN